MGCGGVNRLGLAAPTSFAGPREAGQSGRTHTISSITTGLTKAALRRLRAAATLVRRDARRVQVVRQRSRAVVQSGRLVVNDRPELLGLEARGRSTNSEVPQTRAESGS